MNNSADTPMGGADDARRDWTQQSLARLRQEAARSADTHLLRLSFAGFPGIDFYSSGTNLVACLQLATRMREVGEAGSIVSLLCDPGERYDRTLYDREWLRRQGLDPAPAEAALRATLTSG